MKGGIEGRLHLSNVVDEDPSLRRPDRGRTLSNHARHGPQSREPVSKALPHSARSFPLRPVHSLSLSHTHTRERSVYSKPAGTYTSALSLARACARSTLFLSSLAARASVSASVL